MVWTIFRKQQNFELCPLCQMGRAIEVLLLFSSLSNTSYSQTCQYISFKTSHLPESPCQQWWSYMWQRLEAHVKCFHNLLLYHCGVVINGFQIKPGILKDHFKSNGLSVDHVWALFNPEDQQDVKMAWDMLKNIWELPCISDDLHPGFQMALEAIWILGKLLYYMVFPYLYVDLLLSEQIEHLSAVAHLVLALYKSAKQDFIPKNLYINLMLMIKTCCSVWKRQK